MRISLLALVLLLSCFPVFAKKTNDYSVLIYNESLSHQVVASNFDQRPIASLTKLMTAMVALDYRLNLDSKAFLSDKAGSKLPKKMYTRRELLNAMLVRSDNGAAETLANDYPGGRKMFIKAMNIKAKNLGMNNTVFVDPTGLGKGNISNIEDVNKMMSNASKYNFISNFSVKKEVSFEIPKKNNKTKIVTLENTNKKLLNEFNFITASKTGFTYPAGFCLALAVQKNENKYIIVVLGAKNQSHRAQIVKDLIEKI
jgi:D-alanyl-D-alanine endopeptidase (penicillin-binding protein 7)